MATLLSEILMEAEAPKGARPSPMKRKVRQFFCNPTDQKKLENFLKMSVASGTLHSAVESSVATSLNWINKAIATLRVSPRSASTIRIFQQAFAQPPGWNPGWKNNTMRWIDWGDLIAKRLEKAAHILRGGEIKFFCYGSSTHCSECTKMPPDYYACSSWKGSYVICLGHAFWNDWKRRDYDSMVLTLIHEALHIYFGKTVAHEGRSKNASCYQRFVALINGRVLPVRLGQRCPTLP